MMVSMSLCTEWRPTGKDGTGNFHVYQSWSRFFLYHSSIYNEDLTLFDTNRVWVSHGCSEDFAIT